MINLNKISVCNPNNHEQLKKLKAESHKEKERKEDKLQQIKEQKVEKILEKAQSAEDIIIQKDKKLKAIKKVISMANTTKPKEDIQKKIGRLLDKYYIKEEELEI